jgi:hypothetical protein
VTVEFEVAHPVKSDCKGIPLLGMQIAAGLAILVLTGATSLAVAMEAAADPPRFICAKPNVHLR